MRCETKQSQGIVTAWYSQQRWPLFLLPLTALYKTVATIRRALYRNNWLSHYRSPLPVIVVGNITVGGTGKTPIVIALAKALQQAGFAPGVVSRGYGANPPHYPYRVFTHDQAARTGDEPLLIAKRSGCPVVISPNRSEAIRALLHERCDVILSDDGLQHYAMARDWEIAVIDGQRLLGNGYCLPSGPLREPASRLQEVDWVIANGSPSPDSFNGAYHLSRLQPKAFVQCVSDNEISIDQLAEQWVLPKRVHAVAGIGNPQRFFHTLSELGFDVIEHIFPDHYDYKASDIDFNDELPILMTEKDAVKLQTFADERSWYFPVEAVIDPTMLSDLVKQLKQRCT